MKRFLIAVGRWYFIIGAVFAVIMWSSYMWGIGWGAPAGMGFGARVWANLIMQPAFVFSAVVRLVFWLPSLLVWALTENQTPFLMWLAPGLYTEIVSGPQ